MSSLHTIYHLLQWTISRKTILANFRNFFNDENNLTGDWRVALSEVLFPKKIELIVKCDLVALSLRWYEESQNRATGSNVISRPCNGEKLVFMAGTYDKVAQLLGTIKRTVGLPNFSFHEIKRSGKYEILLVNAREIKFQNAKYLV